MEGKHFIYSYPGAQSRILDCFSDMITYKYPLLKLLEGNEVDIGVLKEKLEALDLDRKYVDASSSD